MVAQFTRLTIVKIHISYDLICANVPINLLLRCFIQFLKLVHLHVRRHDNIRRKFRFASSSFVKERLVKLTTATSGTAVEQRFYSYD